ncbi:MAG TPA: glycosyltransferase family 2 protein [Chitinophagaceae bacterium]|nr:glycosyltransferase family 2 protein [Chitinophagaceae bacterium]
MKVTGFSFIKNAIKYQYPVAEALQSILPLCDEVIVAVGDSEDNTRDLVAGINPAKIKIIDTIWDESIKDGGKVLAAETDKAFNSISADTDWCFYIQGDEVLHEQYHDEVYDGMQRWRDTKEVDGLLFNYRHFYGSYDYVGVASKWYRHEIRIIRNNKNIYSYRDAQGFRKSNNQKLKVKPLQAYIHHYGWVREPKTMFAKQNNFGRFYDGKEGATARVYVGEFDYTQIDALEKYSGSHPMVMKDRIAAANWKFEHDLSYNRLPLKEQFKNFAEMVTGKRLFDYRNYILV